MGNITEANFINLANNMIGTGLLATGKANFELSQDYAKQTAIAFNNWMENENTIWRNSQEEPLTDDELYEIFYQSQNNR